MGHESHDATQWRTKEKNEYYIISCELCTVVLIYVFNFVA